jgi:hypothetical protein
MSVASVAQLLQEQGGGGGGGTNIFEQLYIGLDGNPQVVLECTTTDELLVGTETVATVPYVNSNFISNADYLTTTAFQTYLTTNYTNTTDLVAGYVANATLTDYSTTTEFQNYLTTNYTNTTDLVAGYVANATLTNYLTTTAFQNYLTTNYTNTTDLVAGYVANATLTDYLTTTAFQSYLITNYLTTTAFQNYLTTNYTNTTDLNAGYVANATLTNYYTKTQSDATFQPNGNYILTSTFGRFNGNVVVVPALTQGAVFELINVPINNFVDNDGSASYICGISSTRYNGIPFNTSAIWASTDGTNTLINVSFTNAGTTTSVENEPLNLSVIAMK